MNHEFSAIGLGERADVPFSLVLDQIEKKNAVRVRRYSFGSRPQESFSRLLKWTRGTFFVPHALRVDSVWRFFE